MSDEDGYSTQYSVLSTHHPSLITDYLSRSQTSLLPSSMPNEKYQMTNDKYRSPPSAFSPLPSAY
jgi:hypothetical protein